MYIDRASSWMLFSTKVGLMKNKTIDRVKIAITKLCEFWIIDLFINSALARTLFAIVDSVATVEFVVVESVEASKKITLIILR